MPSIILPSRWRQQPQSLVQVRGRFAKGYVWSAASGVISAGRPAKLVVANAPVATVRGAKAWAFAGGSYSDNISFASVPSITYPWTYLIRLRRRSAQDDARLHAALSGSTEAAISLSVGGSGQLNFYDYGDTWENLGSLTSILPVGEYRTIIVTLDASKVVRAYSQGAAYGSASIGASESLGLGGGGYVGGRYIGAYGAFCEFDVTEVGLLSGALADTEAKALSGNLYGELFVPRRRVLYFETAGGGTTVEPSAGNYAYSGAAPTISQPIAVAPVVGGYSYVGNTPVVSQSTSISPTAGGYSYTGNTPSLSQPVTVAPTTGAYAYLGNTPEIIQAAGIYPTAGEYTYAGNTPAISQPRAIAPAVGAYEYLGNVPSVLQIATIQPDAGTIIYTGNTPSISQPRAIAPQDGSYAYAGGVPGVTQTTTTLTAADLAAIWDDIEIEPGISPRMALRILLAAVGGKRVGLGTATEQYMAQDGTTPRITFSPTDAAGNGTPIVDGS